nr:MAG TPA: Lysozyme [Crassvirales sp.]
MSWNDLSMKDRASYIRMGVENGITDLDTIREVYNKFAEGGPIEKNNNNVTNGWHKPWQYFIPYNVSQGAMSLIRTIHNGKMPTAHNIDRSVKTGSTPQSVFLLDRARQERYMLQNGYTVDDSGDYGLVKKAVGNRNLPIYQTPGLAYDDDGHMNVIGNMYDNNGFYWLGNDGYISHGGSYPTAIYYNDKDNTFYQRGWDLNDYGEDENKQRKGTYSTYNTITKTLANALDFAGNPMVISTGYRKTPYNINNITIEPPTTNDALTTLQRSFNSWLQKNKNSSIFEPYNDVFDASKFYNYVYDDNGDIVYDSNGMPVINRNNPKKEIHNGIIVNTTKPIEVVAERNQKALGGNLFADGGNKPRYKSSSNIRKQISTWEGATMKTNTPFDEMDTMFNQVLPKGALEKLSQKQLDGLYSFAYNVGTGRFKTRTAPTLAKYLQGNATIEDVKSTMWASGDKKYRGLANRRKKERSMLGAYVPVQEAVPMATPLTTPLVTPLDTTPVAQPIIESNPVIQDSIEAPLLASNVESQEEPDYTPGFFDYVNYINQIRQPKQRDGRIWLTI